MSVTVGTVVHTRKIVIYVAAKILESELSAVNVLGLLVPKHPDRLPNWFPRLTQ